MILKPGMFAMLMVALASGANPGFAAGRDIPLEQLTPEPQSFQGKADESGVVS